MNGGDWALFKDDHEEAYKQLPIDPADQRNTIVSLRHRAKNAWFGFVARAFICGPNSAVLRYNVISRILVARISRFLGGAPLVGYFDDFAAMIRAQLGE